MRAWHVFKEQRAHVRQRPSVYNGTRVIWSRHVILNTYKLLLPSLHSKASPVHTKPCISHQRKKLLWLWDDTEAREEIWCNNVSSVNRLQCIFSSYFARGAFDIAEGATIWNTFTFKIKVHFFGMKCKIMYMCSFKIKCNSVRNLFPQLYKEHIIIMFFFLSNYIFKNKLSKRRWHNQFVGRHFVVMWRQNHTTEKTPLGPHQYYWGVFVCLFVCFYAMKTF